MKLHNTKTVILLMLFIIGVANVCASTTPEITIMINGKAPEQSIDEGMAYIAPGTSRVMIPTRIVATTWDLMLIGIKQLKKLLFQMQKIQLY